MVMAHIRETVVPENHALEVLKGSPPLR